VFVNGTFDILHSGHINLLNAARRYGNYLLVAIDCDERVKQLKGQGRPFNDEKNRKLILENLKAVDGVVIFKSDQHLVDIIKEYQPDIMVKGSDWRGKTIVGELHVKKIVFHERDNNESTTKTIEDFIDRRRLRGRL
jgi:rfaE bifunctional protein nucleotidyltransferase chain/domain